MEEKSTSSNMWVIVAVVIVLAIVGFMVLKSDKTEEVVVEEDLVEEVATTPTQDKENNSDIPEADELTVSYTSEGFSPFIIEVNAGDTVNFVNNSQGTMWVTSEAHPTADQHYPEFGMSKSIGPGEIYEFQFTLTGTWGYKNLNNEKHLGGVVVLPQNAQ